MFNTMNTIRPRPYPQKGTGNYNAGNEGTDKDGHNSNGQQQQQQAQNPQVVARGRVEDIQNPQSRSAIYSPAQNAYPQRQTYPVHTPPPIRANYPTQPHQINPQQYQTLQSSYQPIQQTSAEPIKPVAAQRSNKVNIAQILKDFKNTIKAIATPKEIEDEVNRYLQIVEQMVREPKPQVNLIQSNLKIAASLLDKYISETLNKDSKVVQNWLDALFLQRINYSYNEEEINPNFLVKFPEGDKVEKKEEENKPQQVEEAPVAEEKTITPEFQPIEKVETSETQGIIDLDDYQPEENLEEEFSQAQQKIATKPNITIIPQDTRLKSLFLEAKKHAFSNNPQKAMAVFKEAFNRAGELKDN